MALKKSQLYSSLWQSCDQLRGGMDASQYKDYVLTLLFMKYVSDKHAGVPDAMIEVPDGGGFADMARLKGDKEIGDKINKIIGKLAEANDLKGVIDQADFNDENKLGRGKEMQDRLSELVAIFEDLDFRANRTEGDDLLGDAYEYLMRHFATESGKSKGQFYTPAEVSRVMAQVVGIGPTTGQDQTIYDPTCGSGSLLLKAADEAPRGITVYGQEMDNATWALARMNLILHGYATADLWCGNTLAAPYFKNGSGGLRTFDFAVANPPFSAKAWSSGLNRAHDEYGRFAYGIPPDKNGDYAFLLHLITSLNSKGKGAIILPHGVLFRSYREADIRKNLVQRGLIKGIIGLPANLFYGTGIPACILVLDKQNAHARAGIFMIDASNGFVKDGNKNRLRSQDIRKIVDVFNEQTELPRYSRMVPLAEIAGSANEFNLNIPRYIDSSEPEDLHDLGAHLHGGIPNRDLDALEDYWTVFPSLRQALFGSNGRPGYSEALVEASQVKTVILGHEDFKAFKRQVSAVLDGWCEQHRKLLWELKVGSNPRGIIETIAEDLLSRCSALSLLDPYDLYQALMEYWDKTMQDDIYLIVSEGWLQAAKPRDLFEDKERKIKETPDLTVKRRRYKMDLIPPALIVARYFSAEQAEIEALQSKHESALRELDEFVEEYCGEGGILVGIVGDGMRLTKISIKKRLKTIMEALEIDDERRLLMRCLALMKIEEASARAAREAQGALDQKVVACYAMLTEAQIKTLAIGDKWLANIDLAIQDALERVIQQLARRVNDLELRYAQPLVELEREVQAYGIKVEGHLKRMGVNWG